MHEFLAQLINGISLGSIYALIALGYTLVYGVLQLINFAHSEVFMVGSFFAMWTLNALASHEGHAGALLIIGLLVLAGIAAMIGSGITALFVEFIAYRPLRRRNAPRLVFLISAIGASIAISEAFGIFISRNILPVPQLVQPKVVLTLFGSQIYNMQVIIVAASIVMMVGLDQFIRRTRLGRGVRAVAQDQDTAALMGVNKDRVIALTFLLGGLMAGGAALLYTQQFGLTRFNVGFLLGIKAFTAAVLGGIGNLRGALLGGLVLGLAENYGSALVGSQWRDVVAFVLLIVILMFRPTGILGESLGKARA